MIVTNNNLYLHCLDKYTFPACSVQPAILVV